MRFPLLARCDNRAECDLLHIATGGSALHIAASGCWRLRDRTEAAVLSQSDEFRAHASECLKLANFFGGLIRHQYEELARQWLELAERLDNKALDIRRH
jgi:hypothetical protein